ncbi:MAG: glutamyl-tRNA reductase [Acidobacteriaceae bacterium]
MNLVLLGINHKTAPVEVRERLAISPTRLADATRTLAHQPGVREGMILSTCNRVELVTSQESLAAGSAADLVRFIHEYFAVKPAIIEPHLYEYREREAVRHLFRVASSLDSMVVGESQILGQVKESYTVARSVGAVQAELDGLLQRAFTVAKKVRSETQVGSNSVSIASVAVDLARKIFGSLQGKNVLLVGAGKMSELAARHLIQQGAGSVFVANRTHERAIQLATEFGGEVIPFDTLYEHADKADIVITSTGAPTAIFRREHGQQFLQRRRNRPMFFIDIAVPRDVDPEMNRLEGIFLYDIDDLQSVAANHLAERSIEAQQAEKIVAREVERYHEQLQTLDAVPTIVALQKALEEIRQTELRRVQGRLAGLTEEQQAAVDALTRGLLNKFLHAPLTGLKCAAREGDRKAIETARRIFHLELQANRAHNAKLEEDEDANS